jgi:exonuclease VII small subunit
MSKNGKKVTLEDKLLRLQEIQSLLQEKKVSLSESIGLLEEAGKLKTEIERELSSIENKLVEISQENDDQEI